MHVLFPHCTKFLVEGERRKGAEGQEGERRKGAEGQEGERRKGAEGQEGERRKGAERQEGERRKGAEGQEGERRKGAEGQEGERRKDKRNIMRAVYRAVALVLLTSCPAVSRISSTATSSSMTHCFR